MLGRVCLKRLRFVLYAVLFFLLTLDITNRTGDGLIATVCIWLALPLAFIAMVWWIYACVRDTVRLLRDGVAPEDAPLQGVVRLEDCRFEDCILTRWVVFLPPALAAALARDMPEARFLGRGAPRRGSWQPCRALPPHRPRATRAPPRPRSTAGIASSSRSSPRRASPSR